jgi:hypothetical protein
VFFIQEVRTSRSWESKAYHGDAIGENAIDLGGSICFVHENGLGNGELFGGFEIRVVSENEVRLKQNTDWMVG